MIIVTGAAGFIGSNLIEALNQQGEYNILAVDDLSNGHKFTNLVDTRISDYLDKQTFRRELAEIINSKVSAIFHQGACSQTTEWNGRYMMDNNYQYSKELLEQANHHKIPFIYASSAAVYGNSANFSEQQTNLKPLNVYGYSKLLFDSLVESRAWQMPVYGLRYFNVYGPHEQHKGKMASVAYHLFQQYQQNKTITLFGAHNGYQAGAQMRDFIFVEDVVKVNLWLLKQCPPAGIYNCGSGQAQMFNAIADVFCQHYRDAKLEYIDFPEHLKNTYQSFTQADMSRLRALGYSHSFSSLEEGLRRYLDYLDQA